MSNTSDPLAAMVAANLPRWKVVSGDGELSDDATCARQINRRDSPAHLSSCEDRPLYANIDNHSMRVVSDKSLYPGCEVTIRIDPGTGDRSQTKTSFGVCTVDKTDWTSIRDVWMVWPQLGHARLDGTFAKTFFHACQDYEGLEVTFKVGEGGATSVSYANGITGVPIGYQGSWESFRQPKTLRDSAHCVSESIGQGCSNCQASGHSVSQSRAQTDAANKVVGIEGSELCDSICVLVVAHLVNGDSVRFVSPQRRKPTKSAARKA